MPQISRPTSPSPPSSARSAGSLAANLERVIDGVAEARSRGAEIILPPELFEGPYFCRAERDVLFEGLAP